MKTFDPERRARADQAEHVNEMYEGHINALLSFVFVDDDGALRFRADEKSQKHIRYQISRMIGHKEINADHLGIEPFQYSPKQMFPYDSSKW